MPKLIRLYNRAFAPQTIISRGVGMLLLGVLTSCASVEEVAPWDRGYLDQLQPHPPPADPEPPLEASLLV